jgi:hypothetical protein
MQETLAELLASKDFNDDRDRAQFLAGMKLGIIASAPMDLEEARRMIGVVFLNQKDCDPRGETWEKKEAK